MLRCHPPPNEKKLQEVQAALARHDLQVDISSAGALQASLLALQRKGMSKGLMDSVSQLLLRTMNVGGCAHVRMWLCARVCVALCTAMPSLILQRRHMCDAQFVYTTCWVPGGAVFLHWLDRKRR